MEAGPSWRLLVAEAGSYSCVDRSQVLVDWEVSIAEEADDRMVIVDDMGQRKAAVDQEEMAG